MEPNETTLISGRLIAEFEDDAAQFLAGEAEFVRTQETTAVVPATPFVPPTNGAAQEKPA
jgi:hypothetical protein